MKLALIAGIALCASSLFASEPPRQLLLLDYSPTFANRLMPAQVEYLEEHVAVVTVNANEIEGWSEAVHHEMGGCGGFLDVTEKFRAGKSAASIVWEELMRRDLPQVRVNYTVAFDDKVASLVAKADAEKWWAFLTELSSFPDRSATTDDGGKAAQFLKDRADKLGGGLKGFHTWYVETETSMYKKQPSVVATLPGTTPELPAIVIGGHMDTFSTNKPGADDDGSGSSIVMEALRVVATSGATFERTIHFAWYAAEERGLVGSSYVVDRFKKDKLAVEAAIQFDMVGFNSDKDNDDIYVITDYTNASLNSTLKTLIKTYLPEVKIGETKCGYACSDHANWTRAGVPAVFPFEATFNNMNHKLHTGDDKITYLDKKHALNFARLAVAFVGQLAKIESTR